MQELSVMARMDETYDYHCRNCEEIHRVPFSEHNAGNEHNVYQVKRTDGHATFVGISKDMLFIDFINQDNLRILEA